MIPRTIERNEKKNKLIGHKKTMNGKAEIFVALIAITIDAKILCKCGKREPSFTWMHSVDKLIKSNTRTSQGVYAFLFRSFRLTTVADVDTHCICTHAQVHRLAALLPFVRVHIALKYNTVAKHVATSTFPELNPTTAYERARCCTSTKQKH